MMHKQRRRSLHEGGPVAATTANGNEKRKFSDIPRIDDALEATMVRTAGNRFDDAEPNEDRTRLALYQTTAEVALTAYRRASAVASSTPHAVLTKSDDCCVTETSVSDADADESSGGASTPTESTDSDADAGDSYPMSGITKPGPNDVLCGRGHGANNHPGNVRFRNLLKYYKLRYVAAWKAEKPKVAREVVTMWRAMDPPGRFLQQSSGVKRAPSVGGEGEGDGDGDDRSKTSQKTDNHCKRRYAESAVWHDVGDKRAQEKTSQCLREKSGELLASLCAEIGGDDRQHEVLEAIRRSHKPPQLHKDGIAALSLSLSDASHAELTHADLIRAATRAIFSAAPIAADPEAGTPPLVRDASSAAAAAAAQPRGSLDLLAIVAQAGSSSRQNHHHQQQQPQPPFKRRRTEPIPYSQEPIQERFTSPPPVLQRHQSVPAPVPSGQFLPGLPLAPHHHHHHQNHHHSHSPQVPRVHPATVASAAAAAAYTYRRASMAGYLPTAAQHPKQHQLPHQLYGAGHPLQPSPPPHVLAAAVSGIAERQASLRATLSGGGGEYLSGLAHRPYGGGGSHADPRMAPPHHRQICPY